MVLHLLLVGAAFVLCSAAAPHNPLPSTEKVGWKQSADHDAHAAPTRPVTEWRTWYPTQSTSQVATSSATYQSATFVTENSVTSISSASSASSNPASPTAPCGSVAVLAASFKNANPSAAYPTVPAQLAYECLLSIPFNQSASEQYLNSIDPYLNWHTTFEYLKDPPAEYAEKVQPAYDFLATWAEIKANTSANAYQSEYQFAWTVYRASQLAHDGHFAFELDSLASIFSFGRSFPLVSVSLDGTSDPQPYVYADLVATLNGSANFTPSPVVAINGQNAVEYLLVWSQYGSLQDPDALWNNLFWEPAQIALDVLGTGTGTFNGGGRGRWVYPGPSTTLTFANGSTVTQENHAIVFRPFDNITSGADIYANFLIPPPEAYQNAFQQFLSSTSAAASTSTVAATSSSSSTPTSIPAPAYPTPFVSTADNENSGYFIDEPGYENVAVLAVRSFVGVEEIEIPFQSVNTYFIETAASLGKTKLIIDVSANGGGTILQGYDLFKQLFPSVLPYGGNRFRAHEAFNLLGEQTSYLAGLVPRNLDANSTFGDIESSPFNYRTDADDNYKPFESWAEKYGPDVLGPQPDNFSSMLRWNLSDVLTPLNSGGIDVAGYLNRSNITTQPFSPENIIIVTDGYCASTCTIFTEFMTQQGGVKTIALGGRPGGGIIQAVGGVKGRNDLVFEAIFDSIAEIYGSSNASLRGYWENGVLNKYTSLASNRSVAAVINARNGYRQGDSSQTPLQFLYEPADCRILYTPAMVVDKTAVWKTVADSVWGGGGGDACIAGGFGAQSKKRTGRGTSATTEEREKRQLHMARSGIDYQAILDSLSFRSEGLGRTKVDGPFMRP